MGLVSHGNDTQHSSLTDLLSPSNVTPFHLPTPVFFTSFPRPRSCVHLGVVPVLHCAAEVYNLRRLLVWLHLASSSVLYFFCRNSKLGCVPCLSLCHRPSLLCKIKANTGACNHLHGRQHFWQRTQVGLKEKSNTIQRSCQTVWQEPAVINSSSEQAKLKVLICWLVPIILWYT